MVTLVFLISRTMSPSDWVDVKVGPLPPGTEVSCLIAEDAAGVGTLPWYHSKVFPFTMEPSQSLGFWDSHHDGFITASVQWREAQRYGVLVHHRENDRWRLWWLEPGEVIRPSDMRFLVSGGKAEMHLPAEARGQVPTKQFLKRLGFSP